MSDNMKVLEMMIAASKARDHDAFLALLTDDIEYHWNMSKRPVTDKATMRKFLVNYAAAFDQKEWIVLHWAEKGDLMFVEGLEKVYDRARERLIDNPFAQVIEFRSGKICKLRDYYDPALVSAPASKAAAGTPLVSDR